MTTFTFKRSDDETIDFKREAVRFSAEFERDPTMVVDLATKYEADLEIGRQIYDLFTARADASYPAAQAVWHSRARTAGTPERALLQVSMRGVLTMIKHPSVKA